jgi:metal-responsive CopG/Arc/MetJ family transcriptional regulator
MNDYRVTVRLSSDLRQRLKSAAKRRGTAESELVREAVENQLATENPEPSAFELMEESGLIGLVRQAPSDLSTNAKHFDGFGRQ